MENVQPFQFTEEFTPLLTPHVDKSGASVVPDAVTSGRSGGKKAALPPRPVAWFTHIAPHWDEKKGDKSQDGGGVASTVFPSIEVMVRNQREQDLMGLPEPPELIRLREQAHLVAQELVGRAYEQAQSMEDEARERGYQAGFAQGMAEGNARAAHEAALRTAHEQADFRHDMETFLAHMEAERLKAWEALEPQAIDLVFALVTHVIKQEVEVNRSVALNTVRNALRRAASSNTLRIRVHADDLDTLRGSREDLLTLVDGIPQLEIIADRRVGPGGCVVETDSGTIDARVETQLAEIGSLLQETQALRAA